MTNAPHPRSTRLHRPDLRVEKQLLRSGCARLAAMDEVGRGALAGPVTVGVVVVTASVGRVPPGLRDSKLLTPAAREKLVAPVRRWAVEWAVGHAGPDEIDAYGIMTCLRIAAHRALGQLSGPVDAVLLDGNHDYLNPPSQRALFGDGMPAGLLPDPAEDVAEVDGMPVTAAEPPGPLAAAGPPGTPVTAGETTARPAIAAEPTGTLAAAEPFGGPVTAFEPPGGSVTAGPAVDALLGDPPVLPVHLRIKADLRCAGVAAASVLAKTTRDAIMVERAAGNPVYGWEVNKGYATPEHLAAIAEHGPCEWHRRSWRLSGPVTGDSVGEDERQRPRGAAAAVVQ